MSNVLCPVGTNYTLYPMTGSDPCVTAWEAYDSSHSNTTVTTDENGTTIESISAVGVNNFISPSIPTVDLTRDFDLGFTAKCLEAVFGTTSAQIGWRQYYAFNTFGTFGIDLIFENWTTNNRVTVHFSLGYSGGYNYYVANHLTEVTVRVRKVGQDAFCYVNGILVYSLLNNIGFANPRVPQSPTFILFLPPKSLLIKDVFVVSTEQTTSCSGLTQANFTASPTLSVIPTTVTFSDTSESLNTITSWLWDFGDGETSIEQNPTHVYTSSGEYTVSLTTTNDDGSDVEIKTGFLDLRSTVGDLDVDFIAEKLIVKAKSPVKFHPILSTKPIYADGRDILSLSDIETIREYSADDGIMEL